MLLFKHVLVLGAGLDHGGHVHVVERGQHGGAVLGFLQPARDGLAQAGHLHPLFPALGRGGGNGRDSSRGRGGRGFQAGSARLNRGKHVALGQPAILTGAADAGGIKIVGVEQAANRRADGVIGRRFRSRNRRGSRRRRYGSGGHRCGSHRHRNGSGRHTALHDPRNQRANRDRVSGLEHLLAHHAGDRRRHFHRHLVGFQRHNGLVGRDRLAGLFQPLANAGFGDGFAQGGHDNIGCHALVFLIFS